LDSLVSFYFNTNISAAEIIVGGRRRKAGLDRTVGRPRSTAQLRGTHIAVLSAALSIQHVVDLIKPSGTRTTVHGASPYQLIDRSHRRMTGNIVAKDDHYVLYEYMHACMSLCVCDS
jgi:hypothetical protein